MSYLQSLLQSRRAYKKTGVTIVVRFNSRKANLNRKEGSSPGKTKNEEARAIKQIYSGMYKCRENKRKKWEAGWLSPLGETSI